MTTVVTVNFNGGGHLLAAARSVLASTAEVELCVADNGSSDGSLQAFQQAVGQDPRVRIAPIGANVGFSRACNRALEEASGEWLLFLNPDCVLRPDTIARMREVMEREPRAGMAGGLVLNPDGSEQAGCRRERPTPGKAFVRAFRLGGFARTLDAAGTTVRDFVRQGDPLPAHPVEVDAISGAFMFVRRAALDEVGPLDEGYFLHCEDLDWCERFRRAGWRVLFVPHVTVVHDKGASSHERPVRVLWHMHRGMVRYYRKFLRTEYPAPLFALVLAGIWLRFALFASLALARRAAGRVVGG